MQIGQILSALYHNLRLERYDANMVLHHSDVYFVRAAILAGPEEELKPLIEAMSLEEIATILREEGLLSYYEYGIPRWYARKWLGEAQGKRKAIQRVQDRKATTCVS